MAARDVILFDGQCRFCQGAASRLARFLPPGQVELLSFREPGALSRFPAISLERCERAMQLVRSDGRAFQGAEAIVQAVRGRWWGKLWRAYYVPGLRQLADAVYRLVARYRFKIAGRTCENGACALRE